jgi:predicted signal transduction protein with EAL and GGDEF domain
MAERMTATARSGDLLARLGGDEFFLIAEDLAGIDEAGELAQRIIDTLSAPMHVGGLELTIGACAGIALAQDDDEPLTLLHHADLAVHNAKRRGPGSIQMYDEGLQRQLLERVDIEKGLKSALRYSGQLRLEYQPLLDSVTGRLRGVEALLRWDRPGHGSVPPDQFIPVAEGSKLIIDVDRWVMRQAATQLMRWADHPELSGIDMAVNVSGRHLLDPTFVTDVLHVLNESRIDPHRLVLEVTETVLVTDLVWAASQLESVRALGVRVAVDDFGTGYTSLTHLRALPIDEIKIDRSFVCGMPGSSDDQNMIRIVCDLARHLGVPTVAEGVETEAQVQALAQLGCDTLQGYYFSPSLRPEALAAWILTPRAVAWTVGSAPPTTA